MKTFVPGLLALVSVQAFAASYPVNLKFNLPEYEDRLSVDSAALTLRSTRLAPVVCGLPLLVGVMPLWMVYTQEPGLVLPELNDGKSFEIKGSFKQGFCKYTADIFTANFKMGNEQVSVKLDFYVDHDDIITEVSPENQTMNCYSYHQRHQGMYVCKKTIKLGYIKDALVRPLEYNFEMKFHPKK